MFAPSSHFDIYKSAVREVLYVILAVYHAVCDCPAISSVSVK